MGGDSPGVRWWEGGSVYHVYVRSWQDSDGDGFGDLAGVRRRLPHLAWLGVGGVWLSPTMPSPNDDWGYDVADYLGVADDLGGATELDGLLSDAASLGLRVLLDLVPNHTSAAHPWFAGEHPDWYVWVDGGAPNNWLDATGGSAWTAEGGRSYLHNFLPGQPDLDWWNPAVHAVFEDILRHWWDRGVAGFRIDVAHALYKDRELRDDPPAEPRPGEISGLDHRYSMNRPEVHAIYRRWREIAESYDPPRFLLGETWVLDAERLATFYGHDDELQGGFNFVWVFASFTAAALRAVVRDTFAALPAGACPIWVGSNHDLSRMATRWAGGSPSLARLALTLLCTLPGTTVLYYGDELGLPDVPVAPEDQRDPMTWHATDGRFNRDRARTPMPWEPGAGYGFSTGSPWLPTGDRDGIDVATQREDPSSTLWLTKRLLALRASAHAGAVAAYEELPSPPDVWAYRSGPVVVAANLSEVTVPFPMDGPILLSSLDGAPVAGALRPWEAVVIEAG